MLGHAKELEKNIAYRYPEWDSPEMLIKSIKKGKAGVVIKHHDGSTRELDNMAAVRFREPGRES